MLNIGAKLGFFRGMFLLTTFVLASHSLALGELALNELALENDWPQWRGPLRDGVWGESGVRSEMPTDPLPVRWRVPAGLGYAPPLPEVRFISSSTKNVRARSRTTPVVASDLRAWNVFAV